MKIIGTNIGKSYYLNSLAIRRFLIAMVLIICSMDIPFVADPFIAGNFVNAEAVAAMNLYNPMITLVYSLVYFFAFGAMILASYSIGCGDIKEANRIFTTSITSILFFFPILFLLITIFQRSIIGFLCPEPGLIQSLTYDYMSIAKWDIFTGGLFLSLSFYVAIDGNIKICYLSSITMLFLYLFLAVLFAKYTDLGVKSNALAVIISDGCGTAILLIYILLKKCSLKFLWPGKRWFELLRNNVKKGFPQMLYFLLTGISLFLINQEVIQFAGDSGVQIWSIVFAVISIGQLVYSSISEMVSSLCSQAIGEKDELGFRYII